MPHGNALRETRAWVVGLWIVGSLPVPALGQALADPAAPLTLQQAIDEALASNPGIRAAGYEIDIAEARRDLEALPAAMSVEAEAENFLGSGETNGFDSAETTLQLSRVLEVGGKRDLRERLGDARIALAQTNRAAARLDLAAEVTRRFIRVVALEEELVLAGQAVGLAEETLAIVQQRVDVGRSSEAELATTEIALARTVLEVEASENRLEAARVALVTLWSLERAAGVQAEADLFALPALVTFEQLRNRIGGNPALVRTIDERRIIEADRRLAQARSRASVELGFGVRHLGEIDDTALVFGASLPLGSGPRSRAEVAASDAALDQLTAETDERRLEVLSVLSGLHAELTNAYARYTLISDSLLPRSEEAAALYSEGFERGSVTLLEFSQGRNDLLNLRQAALSAAANYHLTLVDIEQLLGGTYETGVIQ